MTTSEQTIYAKLVTDPKYKVEFDGTRPSDKEEDNPVNSYYFKTSSYKFADGKDFASNTSTILRKILDVLPFVAGLYDKTTSPRKYHPILAYFLFYPVSKQTYAQLEGATFSVDFNPADFVLFYVYYAAAANALIDAEKSENKAKISAALKRFSWARVEFAYFVGSLQQLFEVTNKWFVESPTKLTGGKFAVGDLRTMFSSTLDPTIWYMTKAPGKIGYYTQYTTTTEKDNLDQFLRLAYNTASGSDRFTGRLPSDSEYLKLRTPSDLKEKGITAESKFGVMLL